MGPFIVPYSHIQQEADDWSKKQVINSHYSSSIQSVEAKQSAFIQVIKDVGPKCRSILKYMVRRFGI